MSWVPVSERTPPPGEWVITAEEDDAGFALGLGEWLASGEYVDHGTPGVLPDYWLPLPAMPERRTPDLFDERPGPEAWA